MSLAVRLAAEADDHDSHAGAPKAASGMSALHDAMVQGRLDAYRAGVVAEELAEAPAEVAAAVVGALDAHLAVDTAAQLRRRCRRALARVSPDLLRQRAQRAREACGLRRWCDEPGVDRWEGTFPSEDAAEGWAAVDALAQRYVAEGRCSRVDAARSVALMDLVRAQATIDVHLVVTVPAAHLDHESDGARTEVPDRGVDPVTVELDPPADPAGWAEPYPPTDPVRWAEPDQPTDHAGWAEPDGPPGPAWSAVSTARHSLAGAVESSARVEPAKHTTPGPEARWPGSSRATMPVPLRPSGAAVSADDLIEVLGPLAGGPMFVRQGWVTALAARGSVRTTECDADSGALIDGNGAARAAYRPRAVLTTFVRMRDGRCRFPGCSVAARFCDLDHVRPWPIGPTAGANLMCLCRRHHRVKQRPGWSVRLEPDAEAVWTDPTGRVRRTTPRDLLDAVVLPVTGDRSGLFTSPEGAEYSSFPGEEARSTGGPLESLLGVLADHVATGPDTLRRHRRLAHPALVRPASPSCRELRYEPVHGHRSGRWAWAPAPTDPPPF